MEVVDVGLEAGDGSTVFCGIPGTGMAPPVPTGLLKVEPVTGSGINVLGVHAVDAWKGAAPDELLFTPGIVASVAGAGWS
jgi:hypothetical protein